MWRHGLPPFANDTPVSAAMAAKNGRPSEDWFVAAHVYCGPSWSACRMRRLPIPCLLMASEILTM